MRLDLVSSGGSLTMVPLATAEQSLVRGWVKVRPVQLAPPPGEVCLLQLARRTPVAAVATFRALARETVQSYRPRR